MAGTTSIEQIEKKLKADIDQRWQESWDKTVSRDQYGNEIHKLQNTYVLYRKQEKIAEVNRLHTAKMISTIILNDIVHYKDLD
jgi:hypothetical protein